MVGSLPPAVARPLSEELEPGLPRPHASFPSPLPQFGTEVRPEAGARPHCRGLERNLPILTAFASEAAPAFLSWALLLYPPPHRSLETSIESSKTGHRDTAPLRGAASLCSPTATLSWPLGRSGIKQRPASQQRPLLPWGLGCGGDHCPHPHLPTAASCWGHLPPPSSLDRCWHMLPADPAPRSQGTLPGTPREAWRQAPQAPVLVPLERALAEPEELDG